MTGGAARARARCLPVPSQCVRTAAAGQLVLPSCAQGGSWRKVVHVLDFAPGFSPRSCTGTLFRDFTPDALRRSSQKSSCSGDIQPARPISV